MCKLHKLLGDGLGSLDSFEKVFFVLVAGLWGSILDLVKKLFSGFIEGYKNLTWHASHMVLVL